MRGANTLVQLSQLLLVLAAAIALAVTAVLVRRYRRAVVRLMSARLPVHVAAPSPWAPPAGPPVGGAPGAGTPWPPAPRPRSWQPPSPPQPAPSSAPAGVGELLRRRRTVHIAITIGAGGFVGVTYAVLFLLWNDLAILPLRFAFLALVLSWPAVPGVWVASDGDRAWTATVAAVLFVAPVVVAFLAGTGPLTAVVGWALFDALPTLVVAVLFTRAFRAVGVCVLGVVFVAIIGSQVILGGLGDPAVQRAVVQVAISLGVPSGELVFWGTLVGGLVASGALGSLAFVGLGRWYARQWFSDHMLLLGSLCLVFCLVYVASAGLGEPVLLLVGLALFATLAVLVILAFRLLVRQVEAPPRLLVLRVFGHARSSERLLTTVGARWRHVGPVSMIGGPDLATANVEPDEFLTFVAGRLRRLFVARVEEIAERLRTRVHTADPDGRFRVEEWFCFDTTWRPAVEALLAHSDVVLLDLRTFTAHRQGTRHELDLLARTGGLARTVLVVDASTDLALVDAVVAGAGGARPAVVRLDGGAGASAVVDALVARLPG